MRVCVGIVIILTALIFLAEDALTREDTAETMARSDYFLLVDELTPPKEFIGILVMHDTKTGDVDYELMTEENGREVRHALNNKNDPYYSKGATIPYDNIQNTFKALVGNKVKILGQIVSGMRAEPEGAVDAPHTTFHWMRVIRIERLK